MSDFRLQAISFKKHSGGDSFGPAQGVKKTNKICVVIEKRNSIHMWMGRWKKKAFCIIANDFHSIIEQKDAS